MWKPTRGRSGHMGSLSGLLNPLALHSVKPRLCLGKSAHRSEAVALSLPNTANCTVATAMNRDVNVFSDCLR